MILFALLTGKLPFDDDNIRRLLGKVRASTGLNQMLQVKSGVFSMPQFLPKDVKDLLWKMMTVDPSKRATIEDVKRHPWFLSNSRELPKFKRVEELVNVIDD